MLSHTETQSLLLTHLFESDIDIGATRLPDDVDSAVRALCAVLNDGESPPPGSPVLDYLRASDIHIAIVDGLPHYETSYIQSLGFVMTHSGPKHPKFRNVPQAVVTQ